MVGISFAGAHAQTKSAASKQTCKCAAITKTARDTNTPHGHWHHSAISGDVYQVCVERNGHYDCCMHHRKTVTVATK